MSTPTGHPSRLDRLLSYIESDSTNLALRNDAIREACDAGEWKIARALIESGLSKHPGSAALLASLGLVELQAQRYVEAECALVAALAGGLEAPEVRFNLAFCRFGLGDYAQALELLADPVLVPVLPIALLLRARCLHHLDRPLEAIADCKAYLEFASDDADAKGLLSLLLYEKRSLSEARGLSEAALLQNATQLEAMLTLGALAADERDYETAASTYLTLVEAHPLCGRGWLGLALVDLLRMRMDSAKRYIALATATMPDHIGSLHVLAWIEVVRGNFPEARSAFQRALSIDRNFAETHGGLAVVAVLEGDGAAATACIKRALRLQPGCLSARYADALALDRAGKREAAQAAFEELMSTRIADEGGSYRSFVAAHLRSLRDDPETATMFATRH
ncbi:tetratricopeptide (TPR) repeat protein [Povalibacter uvarum]|uniref:Tetratricopeptide (TPR) repeat protein n=1 Tax=Povalibacter uvarum TaxID=732238 RepID=A0A841HGH4_9GAMM|nr:tetratricopeptide repeat protein [Povalibacter uvarum]MBB6091185.1 tetratricopeptide (TPR) repeat protein [Povalibacter uvarum]